MSTKFRISAVAVLILALAGCRSPLPTLRAVNYVDIPRAMDDWSVIARIPTAFKAGVQNAVESCRIDTEDTIATPFPNRKGVFDGPLDTMPARGFIEDRATNATWGLHFSGPIQTENPSTCPNGAYPQGVLTGDARRR